MEAWNTDDQDLRLSLLNDSWVRDGHWLVDGIQTPLVGTEQVASFIGDAIVLAGTGHRTEVVGDVAAHNSCALVPWRTTAPDGTVVLEGRNFFEFEDGLIRRMVGFVS